MKNHIKILAIIGLVLLNVLSVRSQSRNSAYENYIRKYRDIAVHEMKHYHIPASITLAQGLLESGAGQSRLARKSNNHFGIKCGSDWHGRRVRYDDDARNECFRAYKHPRDSYRDHSKFLAGRPRYAFLFKLKITDYKGWAKGLKRAGYATDPRYASRLINIIELYGLNRYDKKGGLKRAKRYPDPHQVLKANGLLYVIVRQGDTFKSLSKELDISERKLRKYNDLYKGYMLNAGDILYLEKKNSKAPKGRIVHVVRSGESMYTIAQKHGIRLDKLYKMNKMKPDRSMIKVGDILRLR